MLLVLADINFYLIFIFIFSSKITWISHSCLGIPLMLSVLADVGGLMAGGLEGAWFVFFL